MELNFFLKGIVIGFSIAAPVGPIGVLVIRRSVADGTRTGFAAGLGAATADAAYGCVAGFGLTAISSFLVRQQWYFGLIGGAFLCYLGVRTFLSQPTEAEARASSQGWLAAYLSTFLLTLANPATILSFVAVFAGFGLGLATDYFAAGVLVLGVFSGSALWWLLLSGAMGSLRTRVNLSWLRVINRCSGVVLFLFGIYALAKLRG